VFWAAGAAAVQQARLAAVQQLQGARAARRQQQQQGVLLAQQQCLGSQGSWGLCLVSGCCIWTALLSLAIDHMSAEPVLPSCTAW
jgi:hypothetical protein